MAALSNGMWLTLLAMVSSVYGQDPTCRVTTDSPRTVVCTAGRKNVVLKRYLVSDNPHTYSITLRNCKITGIEYTALENLPSLEIIDLTENKLTRVRPKILDGLYRMKQLNLSNNLLTGFDLEVFDQMPNLEVLDLKRNKIRAGFLPRGVFDSLKKLTHLDLSNNNIFGANLSHKLFEQNILIEQLDFSNNKISNLPDELLETQKNLRELKMINCSLTRVPKTVEHLENLETLNMADNLITTVTRNDFDSLTNLKIIVLRRNKINKIPENLFQNMRNLMNIDLSHNAIEYIPVNAFRGSKVKNLNLASNKFSFLTSNFCLELKNSGALLTKFYFNQNPFQCPCLLDLLNEVKGFDIHYNSDKYNGKEVVCVTGDEFNCQRDLGRQETFLSIYDKIG